MLLPRYHFCREFSQYETALRDCGGVEKEFAPGEYLCPPSNILSESFYIIGGMTKFSLLTDNTREMVICFFGEGSIFPLITTEQEFTLEPYIVHTAITAVKALALPPAGMRRMTATCPTFSVDAIDHYGKYSNLLLV